MLNLCEDRPFLVLSTSNDPRWEFVLGIGGHWWALYMGRFPSSLVRQPQEVSTALHSCENRLSEQQHTLLHPSFYPLHRERPSCAAQCFAKAPCPACCCGGFLVCPCNHTSHPSPHMQQEVHRTQREGDVTTEDISLSSHGPVTTLNL